MLLLLPCPLAAPQPAVHSQHLLLKFLEGRFPTPSPPSLTFGEDFSHNHLQGYFLQPPLLWRCHQTQGTARGQGAVVANRGAFCSHQHPGALRSAVRQPPWGPQRSDHAGGRTWVGARGLATLLHRVGWAMGGVHIPSIPTDSRKQSKTRRGREVQ